MGASPERQLKAPWLIAPILLYHPGYSNLSVRLIYERKNIKHSWRKDARNYKRYESFVYYLKDNKYTYGIFKYIRKSLRKNKILYSVVIYLKNIYKR